MSSVGVGIVGVGLVGSALAARLSNAGFSITGYDLDAQRLDVLGEIGALAAASAREVFESSSRVILSLPTSDDVEQVIEVARDAQRQGMMIVDTTTGAPEQVAALGESLAKRDIHYLDATIAGSSAAVRAGEAVVMVGGEAGVFEACEDLFRTFAAQAFHVGGWGSGTRMKLVVNLVLGLNRAALAEGLALAERLDLDAKAALEILRAGIAYSRTMDTKGQKMLDGDFEPQARLAQHFKDVVQILVSGNSAGARLPLSEVHAALLEEAIEAGHGEKDNSSIIELFREPPKRHPGE